jgi:CBS domain-containing protein/sporulation protein YlmC with PRC-barrel domain
MSFLSQVQGRPVFDADGARIGQLRDLLIDTGTPYPPVRSLVIERDGRRYSVPWHDVASVTPRGTALRGRFRDDRYAAPSDEMVWLARDVMDKQIVDTTGVKLVRVNDIALTSLNDDLRVAGVDNSTAGLLRRMGMEKAAGWFNKRPPKLIDWEQVDIGPAVNEIRLKVPFHRLQRMRPADIATVVSQMSPGEAAGLFEQMDEETAARAMAELPDEHQAAVIAAMSPEEAADVLEEMEPDEAADLLGDIRDEHAEQIMQLMEPAAAEEVRNLLAYAEDTAGGLMNSVPFLLRADDRVAEAVARLRALDDLDHELHTLFVVDDEDRLMGSVTPVHLLVADPEARVIALMKEDVEPVTLDTPDNDVARKLVRYDLMALPVVDEERRIRGVVTVNDVLDLMTPRSWTSRARRMMG